LLFFARGGGGEEGKEKKKKARALNFAVAWPAPSSTGLVLAKGEERRGGKNLPKKKRGGGGGEKEEGKLGGEGDHWRRKGERGGEENGVL